MIKQYLQNNPNSSLIKFFSLSFVAFSIALILFPVGFTYFTVVSPKFDGSEEDIEKFAKVRDNVMKVAYQYFDNYSKLRIKQMSIGSVELYVSQRDLYEIPFPDRKMMYKELKSAYCAGPHITKLNKLIIKNSQTGEVIDSFRCWFN